MSLHRHDIGRTVLLPRTLPVQSAKDLAPYHFTANEDDGAYSLRRGAPPKAVREAAAEFADGRADLNTFLDRLGVPQS